MVQEKTQKYSSRGPIHLYLVKFSSLGTSDKSGRNKPDRLLNHVCLLIIWQFISHQPIVYKRIFPSTGKSSTICADIQTNVERVEVPWIWKVEMMVPDMLLRLCPFLPETSVSCAKLAQAYSRNKKYGEVAIGIHFEQFRERPTVDLPRLARLFVVSVDSNVVSVSRKSVNNTATK